MNLDHLTPFGRTGVNVTPLAIGTSSWGPRRADESGEQRDERVAAIADAFLEGALRSNLLDTSNMYGDSESEVHIGHALARSGGLPAGQVLQTKLDRDLSTDDFSSDQMWHSLEQSLERLGVQNLQVLYLHDPEVVGFESVMAPGGAVEALVAMKEQGIVASIGISGGPVAMLQKFVETDLFDALVTHNRFTLLDRSASALLDAATERNVGVTNAAPYGAGVLTGDPRFAGTYGYKPIRSEVQASLEAIAALCDDVGVPLAAAALQFSMRDPRVHSTIVGVSSLDRVWEAIGHAEHPIPDELWAAVDEHLPPARVALDMP